ncbi:hypothetical protein WP3W18E01_14980 [Raoultella ornithinolytica]|nr:hypothetical protein ATN83_1601 [Raoultella ornithinolytica]KDV92643.1 hypothetical protein AB00_3290 [Raoultella ornithinolytica 2-156-04_S1_C1]KDX13369.1 hypothetical protein AB28_3296 [Raoultella ornithinolytica 2-156-04_S1_C2]SBM01284.1 Uncharacterised protein [Raoultella ornithinolytica]VEB69024.1 Uncharacterised protein [Raoultella ornithinolytica]
MVVCVKGGFALRACVLWDIPFTTGPAYFCFQRNAVHLQRV